MQGILLVGSRMDASPSNLRRPGINSTLLWLCSDSVRAGIEEQIARLTEIEGLQDEWRVQAEAQVGPGGVGQGMLVCRVQEEWQVQAEPQVGPACKV